MTFDEILVLTDRYKFLDTVILETKKLKQNKETKNKISKAEQEQQEIIFFIEKNYKMLDLIIEASKNDINFEISCGKDTTYFKFRNKEDKHDNFYFYLEEINQKDLKECELFIERMIEYKKEKERQEQIKLNALNKLTEEEKRLLNLI